MDISDDDNLLDNYIDMDQLINEVKGRPPLYRKNFNDKAVKCKLWTEVCHVVIPNWSQLNRSEKEKKVTEMQKRWRNMRDSFKKELTLQRRNQTGQVVKPKRKYRYYNQLMFLVSTVDSKDYVIDFQEPPTKIKLNDTSTDEKPNRPVTRKRKSNMDPCSTFFDKHKVTSKQAAIDQKNPIDKDTASSQQTTPPRPNKPSSDKDRVSYEEILINLLNEKRSKEVDEDESFLMSLLPAFKKFSEDQKYIAKIEILNAMRQVSKADGAGGSQMRSPSPTSSADPLDNLKTDFNF